MIKRILPLLILWSCENAPETQRLIDAHYEAVGNASFVENIVTKAEGTSPEGDYYTETHSSFDDNYLLFLQDYSFKPNPLNAVIFDWKMGQGLDTTLTQQGALSGAVIAVLKAHEFHEIVMQLEDRFSKMTLLEDTTYFDQKCSQVITSDHLGLPVRVYFDKQTNLMAGFSEVNPYRKGEVIRIHFDNWQQQGELKVFKNVIIKQGETSTYTLDYQEIIFNDPDFIRLTRKK